MALDPPLMNVVKSIESRLNLYLIASSSTAVLLSRSRALAHALSASV